jgi:hypothetical protein
MMAYNPGFYGQSCDSANQYLPQVGFNFNSPEGRRMHDVVEKETRQILEAERDQREGRDPNGQELTLALEGAKEDFNQLAVAGRPQMTQAFWYMLNRRLYEKTHGHEQLNAGWDGNGGMTTLAINQVAQNYYRPGQINQQTYGHDFDYLANRPNQPPIAPG